MSTTDTPAAEARDALDLDAIEKRADAATEGPWFASDFGYSGEGEPSSIVVHQGKFDWQSIRDGEFVASMPTWDRQESDDADFIAQARTDVPALVARIRELESATALVIPADTRPYETQSAALDALPVHTLVSYRDHDGELHTLEKAPGWGSSDSVWWETTARLHVGTYNLVRNEVDYTIVRMGDGS
jgi:hypothetical protein